MIGMACRKAVSPSRVSAVAVVLILPIATNIAAYESPVQHSEPGSANNLKLNAAAEKDSYEIYSILLRTEMAGWNITGTGWAIEQETQTFPHDDQITFDVCCQPPQDQESIYRPVFDDYVTKNSKLFVLDRKFDLPQYALVGPTEIKAIQQKSRVADGFPFNASVIFHVSAVGFNRDGTRALVYVGHHCGSLCGGGTYHLLLKKDGRWQADQEYRGAPFCLWAS